MTLELMREWLTVATAFSATIIDAIALPQAGQTLSFFRPSPRNSGDLPGQCRRKY